MSSIKIKVHRVNSIFARVKECGNCTEIWRRGVWQIHEIGKFGQTSKQ